MAIALADVMNAMGTALATVPGLRVFDFPPASAQPPFAYIDMPDVVSYDLTFGRGFDRFTIPVVVAVGTQIDRNTRDALAAYVDGQVIKAALETTAFFLVGSGVLDQGDINAPITVRVASATFATVQLAQGAYPGVVFSVDVAA